MLNKLSLSLKGRRRGTASLVRFHQIKRTDQHVRRYTVARAGPTLGVLLLVGPIDVKKLRLMTRAELLNGLVERRCFLIFLVPCPSRPGELGPCLSSRCPGRRRRRRTH